MGERAFTQTFEKIYHEIPYHGNSKIVIRMVRWNQAKPYIEKREFFKPAGSEDWKPGKAKGFTSIDFGFLLQRQKEMEEDFVLALRN